MCLPGLPDSLGNGNGVPDGKNGSEKPREYPRPHPARADCKEGLSREERHKFANANPGNDGHLQQRVLYPKQSNIKAANALRQTELIVYKTVFNENSSTFASLELAKPLNNAQIGGSFYKNEPLWQ